MADVKVSGLPSDSSLDGNHYVPINDPTGPTTKRTLLSTLAAWLFNQDNIPAGSGSPVTRLDETLPDAIFSGGVWTGDALGSTRNASMTAIIAYINGRRLAVSAVVARNFTASKDTYIDMLDNLNGTASLVYTEVANGAAAPALASNSIRLAKIITGATTIAAASSILQTGLDSLTNIYSPRPVGTRTAADANGWTKKSYGSFDQYEQRVTINGVSVGAGANVTAASLSLPVGIIDTSYVNIMQSGIMGFLGRVIPGFDNGNTIAANTTITSNLYNVSGGTIAVSGYHLFTLTTR